MKNLKNMRHVSFNNSFIVPNIIQILGNYKKITLEIWNVVYLIL